MALEVEIDEKSGFCYGVIRAIGTAEEQLESGGTLYSLGEIVHNNVEVERLRKKGFEIVSVEDFERISNGKVLIRAHGEPPETYDSAKKYGIEIIDCTCPVVLKLQERIKKAYVEAETANGQLVIFGKRGHAEVNGLVGRTEGNAIVIENVDEADNLDFTAPIYLFSQTTESLEGFNELRKLIETKIRDAGGNILNFKAYNTTCKQVTERKPHLENFAGKHDVVIFVSGKQSSNGKMLYKSCKDVNPRTRFVEKPSEVMSEWFENCSSAGVCGATSTPKRLMEEVAEKIREIMRK